MCLPSGKATRQLTAPESAGFFTLLSRFEPEPKTAAEDTLEGRRTSQISTAPLRLPAQTWVPVELKQA